MNTIIDLNNAANVSYNLQSDYQLVFGNSLGNATANVSSGFGYELDKQVPITTLSNCVRDVLVELSFPVANNVSTVSDVVYKGIYGNIGFLKTSSTTWRGIGVRDINRYDELFANSVVIDNNTNTNYTFTTTVNDQFGNTRTWYTDVTTNTMDRTYLSNTVNSIFSASTPQIVDGPDLGQTYTITLTTSLGKFGNSAANAVAASSYSFTGNITQVNSEFNNMVFVPNLGPAATGTYTYTQARNGVPQRTITANLVGTTATLSTLTFTANTTWTPTFAELYYSGNANIVVVGGGGGAVLGGVPSGGTDEFIGGAGGGGEIRYKTVALSDQPYTIVVGAGGAGLGAAYNSTGNIGGNSSITSSDLSMTARGGRGGNLRLQYNPPPAPIRYTLTDDNGGNGGGNITGTVTIGYGGGQGPNFYTYPTSGTSDGTASDGSTGGAGGAQGYPFISLTQGGNGAAGITTPATGNLVLGGGGASRSQLPGTNGIPGGNSYGLGGSSLTINDVNGTAGAVVIQFV